ncbi:DNA-3-methyladenine glycosylase I [Paraneptunicella aestuarii]|uniref:DNA-3-methyladenine glycosylase I n=1 Tax=Paraneptunicella aestuarii TaxID=2831148 RepID=UPI001E3A5655|nr:DNA-3-methyladenine glycosylase I [Paraneptunicella aestuarii]UAA38718.1 DNA-3-methyladenine glycosylase I [Paraneptunicella aestuarii]
MPAEHFDAIYARAAERKGGEAKLESMLSQPLSSDALAKLGDDRYLAEFTKKVFQSGFVWRVVEQKWPEFERLFFNFDIEKMLLLSDEMFEQKAQDPAIIRNLNKVMTIRDNAIMISDVQKSHGSFANFIAQWPENDIIGLWQYLKQHGARLGGNTGPYALRALGKDTFLLSRDVEGYLKSHDIISGSSTSKRSQEAIQQTFNIWREQSGRSLQEISRIVSYSSGDNNIMPED